MPLPNPTISHSKADPAPSKEEITRQWRQTYVRLRPEVHKRLRFLAVERDLSMVDLIAEAVDKYLADQGFAV